MTVLVGVMSVPFSTPQLQMAAPLLHMNLTEFYNYLREINSSRSHNQTLFNRKKLLLMRMKMRRKR
jgi:hypothetical protein